MIRDLLDQSFSDELLERLTEWGPGDGKLLAECLFAQWGSEAKLIRGDQIPNARSDLHCQWLTVDGLHYN
jgi:hypothetical protein